MSKSKKHILTGVLKIASFALVFALVLQVLSLTYFSKANSSEYSGTFSEAYSFLNEPDNTIDVIAIGNSDLYSALVPAKLWDKHGFTCNVISSPHQTVHKSYRMLETMYETQSPKVVIVEVDMLYDTMVADRCAVSENSAVKKFIGRMGSDCFDETIKDKLSVFTFHDRWKRAGRPPKPDVPHSHGYKYCCDINKIRYTNHMLETDETEPIKQDNIRWLKAVVKLCKSHGSEVYFAEMFSCTSWNTERHNAAAELAQQMGIDFVDYNLLVDELKIKPRTAFRDGGNHLNYYSACKVSDHIGDYLAKHYDLPDKRNDSEYSYYQKSIDSFYREIKHNRAM